MQPMQHITALDRQAINQALAKAIAYKNCGNRERQARDWARTLVRLLQCADILAAEI